MTDNGVEGEDGDDEEEEDEEENRGIGDEHNIYAIKWILAENLISTVTATVHLSRH
jgi:hypothetical protein